MIRCIFITYCYQRLKYTVANALLIVHKCWLIELGGMTKNLYHGIFLNYTGFTVYDGIFFFLCMTGC